MIFKENYENVRFYEKILFSATERIIFSPSLHFLISPHDLLTFVMLRLVLPTKTEKKKISRILLPLVRCKINRKRFGLKCVAVTCEEREANSLWLLETWAQEGIDLQKAGASPGPRLSITSSACWEKAHGAGSPVNPPHWQVPGT